MILFIFKNTHILREIKGSHVIKENDEVVQNNDPDYLKAS